MQVASSGIPVSWVEVGYLLMANARRCLGLSPLRGLSVLLSGVRVFVQRTRSSDEIKSRGQMEEVQENDSLSNIIRSYGVIRSIGF